MKPNADSAAGPRGPRGWRNWRAWRANYPRRGPRGWRNWRLWRANYNYPSQDAVEVACYTDAWLTGDRIELGPYLLLNTIPGPRQPGSARLALVLRVEDHLGPPDAPDKFWERTDTSTHHGGWLGDELAALVSLALGIRLASGGIVREFSTGSDPRGRPREWSHRAPYLPEPAPDARGRVLPAAAADASLDNCTALLSRYPDLPADQAIALVRAARAYQQALWIAEDDPRQAWLRLVAAVEVAADHWGVEEEPAERLKTIHPHLAELLEAKGGDHLRAVAAELARIYGSTGKFSKFLTTFAAQPPPARPPEGYQVDWSKLKTHLGAIYRYRSKDLHAGIPIPDPMCEPPHRQDDWAVPSEISLGLGTWVGPESASWTKADIPMLLHVFEGIVRRALTAWWQSTPAGGTLITTRWVKPRVFTGTD